MFASCFEQNRIQTYLTRRVGSANWEHGPAGTFASAMSKRKAATLIGVASSEDESDDKESGVASGAEDLLADMANGLDAAAMPPPAVSGDCSVALIHVRSVACAVLDL